MRRATLFLACLCAPLGAGAKDYAEVRNSVAAALEQGDCGAAFGELWPLAITGSAQARADLASLAVLQGLRLPGASLDALAFFRETFVLSLHGAAAADPAALDIARDLARISSEFGTDGVKLQACLDAASPDTVSGCLDRAIEQGIVPAFDDFAAEIEHRTTSPSARPAICGAWPGATPEGEIQRPPRASE